MPVNINKPTNVSQIDIEQFIGIVIFTSFVLLPKTRMYRSFKVGPRQVSNKSGEEKIPTVAQL